MTWSYPVVWRVPHLGTFRFQCVAFSVNEIDCLDIDEWVPADAETFALVEQLAKRRARRQEIVGSFDAAWIIERNRFASGGPEFWAIDLAELSCELRLQQRRYDQR